MDIKQTLRAWLADKQMAAWWTPGTREAMAGALAEIERLEKLVRMGRLTVEDFMPNIGRCALQDYARLNEFLCQAARTGEDS